MCGDPKTGRGVRAYKILSKIARAAAATPCRDLLLARRRTTALALFDEIDANADGVVSPSELIEP